MANSKFLLLVYVWCSVLVSQAIFAQDMRDFKKELKEANLNVYQDAEKAVALSLYVYKNSKDSNTQIQALVTLVNGYTSLNQYGEALKYATTTLELANHSNNIQYQIWALGLLGEQYQLSHLNEISRDYLNRAETLIKNSDLSKEAIAVSRGNIFAIKGNGYKDEIDCDYAIRNYDLAIESYQAVSDEAAAQNNLALVFLEKGNCLVELNDLDLAEKNFRMSLEIAEHNQLEEYIQKATFALAKIDAYQGEYEISKKTAMALLESIDTVLHPQLKNQLYLLLQDNELALGNIPAYKIFQDKYSSSSSEICEMEKNQFQQVFQFIELRSDRPSKKIDLEELLIIVLSFLSVGILIFEIYSWLQARKRP